MVNILNIECTVCGKKARYQNKYTNEATEEEYMKFFCEACAEKEMEDTNLVFMPPIGI